MGKTVVTFLTGIPGTGKSTTGRILEKKCQEAGKIIKFYNDYPYLIRWANENRGDESKVKWFMQENDVENFDIVPAAYRGMSAWIAQEIAREVHAEINTTDVVVIESARGAGPDGGRDRYGEELFQPFITELGSDVTFANVEMVVRDMETVIQRMDERLLTETNAAPSFVTLKYISEVEGVQSSFHQAQHEGAFDLNSVVDNSGDIDDTMILVEGLTAQVMALLARGEGILPEGQRRRKED